MYLKVIREEIIPSRLDLFVRVTYGPNKNVERGWLEFRVSRRAQDTGN